ncbi:hypothetical protein ABK040_001792 [Willaertia magna]
MSDLIPDTLIGPIAGWQTTILMNIVYIIIGFITTIFIVRLFYSLTITQFHLTTLRRILPECSLLILIGVIIGIIVKFTSNEEIFDYIILISNDVFLNFLLPPVVFRNGYVLNTNVFFSNFILILVYAVVGTLLNALCISFTLWGFSFIPGLYTYQFELLEFLLFGALISAVDPVAVLSAFNDAAVNNTLSILVQGEAILKGVTSILLFNLFKAVRTKADSGIPFQFEAGVFFLIVAKFLYMSLGGFIIGVFFSIVGIFFSKFTSFATKIEPMIVIIVSMIAFTFGNSILVSGMYAILFSGIFLGHYLKLNITPDNTQTIVTSLTVIAILFESSIFLYLGITLLILHLRWDTAFILLGLAFTLLYRFVITFFLTFFYNVIQWKRKRETISLKSQFIFSYGGVRGVYSFALCLVIPTMAMDPLSEERKEIIITATIFIVLFTIFVNGGTIGFLIKLLKIPTTQKSLRELNETLRIERNIIKKHELCVLVSINQIKNCQKEKHIKKRLKFTIKEVKKLLEIFEKGNSEFYSVVIQNNPVGAKRKQVILGLKLKWKEYLNTLNLDQLATTFLNIEYCFNYLQKLMVQQKEQNNNEESNSTVINIENNEEQQENNEQKLLFQTLQQIGIITFNSVNRFKIEEWAADDEYLFYLTRILNQMNIEEWLELAKRRNKKKHSQPINTQQQQQKQQKEGSPTIMITTKYDKLLYVLFRLLEGNTNIRNKEMEHLRCTEFALKVFGLSIDNTMKVIQIITGIQTLDNRFKGWWRWLDKWIKKLLIRKLHNEEKSLIYAFYLLKREINLEKEIEIEESEKSDELRKRLEYLNTFNVLKQDPKVNLLRINEEQSEESGESKAFPTQSLSMDANMDENTLKDEDI